jgi:hypothetical protein
MSARTEIPVQHGGLADLPSFVDMPRCRMGRGLGKICHAIREMRRGLAFAVGGGPRGATDAGAPSNARLAPTWGREPSLHAGCARRAPGQSARSWRIGGRSLWPFSAEAPCPVKCSWRAARRARLPARLGEASRRSGGSPPIAPRTRTNERRAACFLRLGSGRFTLALSRSLRLLTRVPEWTARRHGVDSPLPWGGQPVVMEWTARRHGVDSPSPWGGQPVASGWLRVASGASGALLAFVL